MGLVLVAVWFAIVCEAMILLERAGWRSGWFTGTAVCVLATLAVYGLGSALS